MTPMSTNEIYLYSMSFLTWLKDG